MKYIKTYEKMNNNPEIGDYVICNDQTQIPDDIQNFIQTNIGQIIDYEKFDTSSGRRNDNPYCVKYENVPEEYCKYNVFLTDVKMANLIKFDLKPTEAVRYFNKYEFVHISKDKEYLETFLIAKKYNL